MITYMNDAINHVIFVIMIFAMQSIAACFAAVCFVKVFKWLAKKK